jgi:hypothetical protein
MKSQPVTLSLLAFNLLFSTLVFLGSKDFRANQLELMKMMINLTGDSQKLLAECVVPQERRGSLEMWMLPPVVPSGSIEQVKP